MRCRTGGLPIWQIYRLGKLEGLLDGQVEGCEMCIRDSDTADSEAGSASRPVLNDVTWLIGAGDRFGLLGENGAGKSTLLNVIQGKIAPFCGRVKIGQTVRFGVLSQQLEELDPHMDETIREILSTYKRVYIVDGKETSPEKLCERLGFTTKQLWSRIKDLSGGQRRRLSLLLTILDAVSYTHLSW